MLDDPYDDEEEDLEEDDTEYTLIMREQEEFARAKFDFEQSGRNNYDFLLDKVRQSSSVGVALPSADETAWMTEEERRCVEWFDRRDYDTFMKRSAWYEGDGWIVPYCRLLCEDRRLASAEVLDGYANDYMSRYGYLHERHVCDEMSRQDRFLRVADKIFEAAKGGNARAQNAVGRFCESRRPSCAMPLLEKHLGKESSGVAAAREWYRRSAEAGCIQGQRNYARALLTGLGWHWCDEKGGIDRKIMEADRRLGMEWYRKIAERGDGLAQYRLACLYAENRVVPRDVAKCAEWMRRAAASGWKSAADILATAGDDRSDERICAELLIAWAKEKIRRSQQDDVYDVAYCINVIPPAEKRDPAKEHGKEWLLKDTPEGTVVPPPSSRETVRTPNLTSANPSFAAQLIIYVRDRFGGDAPRIYRAAQVSRKTYSSIISNELRPVSKRTAMAFALALELSWIESFKLLKAAGFAFSDFLLEDMIVRACILSGIHDMQKVNQILAAHGVEPLGGE
jgi:TPR repeat protein